MKVVLYRPQIPQNCGNVVRTCAVTGSSLILVRPLGFSTANRHLKRAGLDYWEGVDVEIVDSLEEVWEREEGRPIFFSSKASRTLETVQYPRDALLIFGSESEGFSPEIHDQWSESLVRIPMVEGRRCLNLATSVGIALYTAWQQQGFPDASR